MTHKFVLLAYIPASRSHRFTAFRRIVIPSKSGVQMSKKISDIWTFPDALRTFKSSATAHSVPHSKRIRLCINLVFILRVKPFRMKFRHVNTSVILEFRKVILRVSMRPELYISDSSDFISHRQQTRVAAKSRVTAILLF